MTNTCPMKLGQPIAPHLLRASVRVSVLRRRPLRARAGLSLLEAMFAIAILGLSLAAIGRLVQLGFQAAGRARIQSQAQILCDSKMAEVAAGALPLESVSSSPIDEVVGWRYSVEVQPAQQIGLLVVKVTVQQDADEPLGYSIVRFMPDPNFEFNESTE